MGWHGPVARGCRYKRNVTGSPSSGVTPSWRPAPAADLRCQDTKPFNWALDWTSAFQCLICWSLFDITALAEQSGLHLLLEQPRTMQRVRRSLWAPTTCSVSHILSHLRGHFSTDPQPNYSATPSTAIKRSAVGVRGSRAVAMATVTQ